MSKQSETDWKRVDEMTDEEINTSDIPPLDDDFFARAKLHMPRQVDDGFAVRSMGLERMLWPIKT